MKSTKNVNNMFFDPKLPFCAPKIMLPLPPFYRHRARFLCATWIVCVIFSVNVCAQQWSHRIPNARNETDLVVLQLHSKWGNSALVRSFHCSLSPRDGNKLSTTTYLRDMNVCARSTHCRWICKHRIFFALIIIYYYWATSNSLYFHFGCIHTYTYIQHIPPSVYLLLSSPSLFVDLAKAALTKKKLLHYACSV